jgi:hypothetical protein
MPLIDTNTLEPVPAKKKWLTKLALFLLSFLLILTISGITIYFSVYRPLQTTIASAKQLQTVILKSKEVAASKDLVAISTHLDTVKSQLDQVETDLSKLYWLKSLPYAKNYVADGEHAIKAGQSLIQTGHVALEAVTPYADLLGLKTAATDTNSVPQKAKDRITVLIETLDLVKPKLGEIGSLLQSAKDEVAQIDPNRYPDEFRGVQVKSQLTQAITALDEAANLVNEARPLLEAAPVIVGKDKPIKYLVIFQNDAELRPTGGFMTGYAVINVSKGKITVEQSSDIYKLDERFPKRIPAPQPILKYHPKVPYWYLRDQNLSPDFKVSMDTFYPNYKLTNSPQVSGIIAVDTQLLVNLLKVTGPIGIPGYGNFSADNDPRCNCPNAFYQLQILAGAEEPVVWDSVSGKIVKAPANYEDRKRFLGPVMYSILANVMGQPKEKFPLLFQTAIDSIDRKDVQLYFLDESIQAAVESANVAGRVTEPGDQTDYLFVVDTNFSGGKTNIWVKYAADQKIEIDQAGNITKTLTLTYTNPEDSSIKIETGRKLNGMFHDWLRVYVPKGSELLEASGFETGQATSEDLDKAVFEGFFSLAPAGTRVIKFKYKLPFKASSSLPMLIQKQAGAKDFAYTISVNSKKHPEFFLSKDTRLNLPR